MAEAEDVLLAAAERVTAAARALWTRGRDPRDAAGAAAAAGRRRLGWWLVACSGRSFAVAEVAAAPAPGWLARRLSSPAPWQLAPRAIASRAGDSLLLPLDTFVRLGSSLDTSALLPALGLALRGSSADEGAPAAASALERDLAWGIEGAWMDVLLARTLPGLAPALQAARRDARAARPPLGSLRPAERALETRVRSLLEDSLDATPARLCAWLGGDVEPARLRRFARGFARSLGPEGLRGYRGLAPVPHWGVPGPAGGAAQLGAADTGAADDTSARVPSRTLGRRLARRRGDPAERPPHRGAFMLAPGDPERSVQDARGIDRPLDRGDEELDALAEELARLDALHALRSPHPVREILADPVDRARAGAAPAARRDAGDRVLAYPEWDHRRAAYRMRGCLVREEAARPADPDWAAQAMREHAALLYRVRRQFEALRPRRTRVPRRVDGDGIDVAAFVEELAERRAGNSPDGRIYSQERPGRRDAAVALLLDASGSTDAWVSHTQRVIDVAKTAALCFSEALAALGDRHAIYAFSGRGPGDVRILVPKRFEEACGASVRARIGALQPDRFTRLGGALRHVTASLARSGARLRLLLLLSDGKPNDEDAYEGEYGVEDVRQAVIEARALGVRPFCITIDREGPSYLPRIFGVHGYTVLQSLAQLPARLPRLYRRLAADAG